MSMGDRGFKRVNPAPQSKAVGESSPVTGPQRQDLRRDPATALAAAASVAPTLPPTRVEPPPIRDPVGQLNLKVRTSLIDQLANAAIRESTTQKVLVCRALAEAGYLVHPDDLNDRGNHRRRRRHTI